MKSRVKFIKEQIEKSGFPFEMRIAATLKEHGWDVLPSSPYWDEDEEKWREIDIKAYKSINCTQRWIKINSEDAKQYELYPYHLSLALIIQCKKTDKFGWVFFLWPRDARDLDTTRINFVDLLTLVKRQSLLTEEIRKGNPPSPAELRALNLPPDIFASYQALVTPEVARKLKFFSELNIIAPNTFKFLLAKKKALTYQEIKLRENRKGSGPHEIFESINTLIKAIKYDMKLHSYPIYAGAELAKRNYREGRLEIMIFLPILVFGGELYTWIDGNADESSEVLVEGKCATKRYFENMLINVVRENHFNEFLSKIDKDLLSLSSRLVEGPHGLDEQIKLIMESPYP